jgi:hypothetical protein
MVTVLSRIVEPSVAVLIPPAAFEVAAVLLAAPDALEDFFFGAASEGRANTRAKRKYRALNHGPGITAMASKFEKKKKATGAEK